MVPVLLDQQYVQRLLFYVHEHLYIHNIAHESLNPPNIYNWFVLLSLDYYQLSIAYLVVEIEEYQQDLLLYLKPDDD